MAHPPRRPLAAGLLLAAALAAGCGEPAGGPAARPPGGTPGAPAASPPSGPAAGTAGTATDITVTVARGKARTGDGRSRVTVRRGAAVRITVTSDTADEFHLHGYDRTLDLAPGRPATLALTADRTGVFEAELHHSGIGVLQLQVG